MKRVTALAGLALLAVSAVYVGALRADGRDADGLIRLYVTVRDTSGKVVPGLNRADFTLLDNGEPARIASVAGAPARSSPTDSGTTVVLLIDALDAAGIRKVERRGVAEFLRRNGGRLEQPVAIFSLDDSGFWLDANASLDGNALASAVERRPSGAMLLRQPPQPYPIRNESTIPVGTVDTNYSRMPWLTALKALGWIAAAESQRPGRKLLLWVGPGVGTGSGAYSDRKYFLTGTAYSPQEFTCPVKMQNIRSADYVFACPEAERSIFGKAAWLSALLRESGVIVDTFSVGSDDLDMPRQSGYVREGAAGRSIPPAVRDRWKDYLDGPRTIEEANPMNLHKNVLAVQSGGSVFEPHSDDELAEQMSQSVQDAGAFYGLTFNPPPAARRDEYHSLRVQMERADLSAQTQRSYYDEPFYSDVPDPGRARMTPMQLAAKLRDWDGLPAATVESNLGRVEFTESWTDDQLAQTLSAVSDARIRDMIRAMADSSSFLRSTADPATEPPPSSGSQREMLTNVGNYLGGVLPRLPNFFATRTAVQYTEDSPGREGELDRAGSPPHVVARGTATVIYRDGAEVVEAPGGEGKQPQQLRTYGTFGPILSAVQSALKLPGAVSWSRWSGAGEDRRAIFRFEVKASDSKYFVVGCCRPGGDGKQRFAAMPGYHGEVEVNPGTGAVLRVQLDADLEGFVPADRSDLMVRYGTVSIGGQQYVLPLRSVSVLRHRAVWRWWEWDEGFLTWGPWSTNVDDFTFSDYHVFRGSSRILQEPADGAGEKPRGINP